MKKGITLITLSTVIIIMVIILTTVTISGVNAINNSKKMKFASELLFMQEAVEDYKLLNSGELPVMEVALTNEKLPEGEYYEINMSLLGLIDTTYGRKLNSDEEDIYVVSASNDEVYYLKGLKIGNITYYYLNDELKQIINYTEGKEVIKDGIIFTQSNKNYTNSEITLGVQVPTKYSNISVISQDIEIANFTEEGNYYVYEIAKASNFDVVVTYTKDETNLKQVYTVSNYDDEAPNIEVLNVTNISQQDEINITILTNDNLSGINKVLYEVGNVEKNYFETEKAGNLVVNNNISVNSHTQYVTFYVVDNAGNSQILLETLNPNASVDDYVKYGLLVHLDSINNAGSTSSSTTTIWKDLSGNENNGILNNIDGTENSGWNDGYLVLDGTDDFVKIGLANYEFTKGITLSMIVRFDEYVYEEFFGNWESAGGGLGVYSANKITCNFNINNTAGYEYVAVQDTEVIELNRDYNISFTYDGNNLKLYVDGVLKSTNTYTGTIKTSTVPILIGANLGSTANSNYSKVSVKKAMVYNRGLTDEEIKQNYDIDKIRFGI